MRLATKPELLCYALVRGGDGLHVVLMACIIGPCAARMPLQPSVPHALRANRCTFPCVPQVVAYSLFRVVVDGMQFSAAAAPAIIASGADVLHVAPPAPGHAGPASSVLHLPRALVGWWQSTPRDVTDRQWTPFRENLRITLAAMTAFVLLSRMVRCQEPAMLQCSAACMHGAPGAGHEQGRRSCTCIWRARQHTHTHAHASPTRARTHRQGGWARRHICGAMLRSPLCSLVRALLLPQLEDAA